MRVLVNKNFAIIDAGHSSGWQGVVLHDLLEYTSRWTRPLNFPNSRSLFRGCTERC